MKVRFYFIIFVFIHCFTQTLIVPVWADEASVAATEAAAFEPDDAFPQGESAFEEGARIFKSKCAACHGLKGQGMVGPNMTDSYWIHGDGSLGAIFNTVVHGVPEKGMISWQTQLSEEEMRDVTVYVHSLKGTSPKKPKAPEGTLIE